MKYDRVSSGEVHLLFGPDETPAVSRAFHEYNELIEAFASEEAIPDYHRRIARWKGLTAVYICEDIDHINDVFEYFDQTTEHSVDEILADTQDVRRIQKAARRYRMQRCVQGLRMDMNIEEATDGAVQKTSVSGWFIDDMGGRR